MHRLQIALFLLLSTTLSAMNMTVVQFPNKTLCYLIGIMHKVVNTNPGGNAAVIEKFLEILHNGDRKANSGYRCFIERADCALFNDRSKLDTKDLLSAIFRRIGKLKNTELYDIETRRASSGAKYIFTFDNPNDFAKNFRGEFAASEEANQFRTDCHHRFQHDLNELTLQDVLDEWNEHVDWVKETSKYWSSCEYRYLKEWIAARFKDFEHIVKKLNLPLNESILTLALQLHRDYPLNGFKLNYYGVKGGLFEALDEVGSELFDLILLDRLLNEGQNESDKPIILIAGGTHTSGMKNYLTYRDFGGRVVHEIRRYNEDKTDNFPLFPEDYEILEDPYRFFTIPTKPWISDYYYPHKDTVVVSMGIFFFIYYLYYDRIIASIVE